MRASRRWPVLRAGGREAAGGNTIPGHHQRRPEASSPHSRIGYQTTVSSLWPTPVADASWLDADACRARVRRWSSCAKRSI